MIIIIWTWTPNRLPKRKKQIGYPNTGTENL